MSINYITFENFNYNDYEEFINDIPKKTLLLPIKKIHTYRNNPLIKSFRDDAIDDKIVRDFYLKEYKNKKSTLQNHLLVIIDKNIKEILNTTEYTLLRNNEFDNNGFNQVALKMLDKSSIKPKYLKKFFDIQDDVMNEYENNKNSKKIEKELVELKKNDEKLRKKIKELEKINGELTEKTNNL